MTVWPLRFFTIAIAVASLVLSSNLNREGRTGASSTETSNVEDAIAITGATLIDGSGQSPINDAVVIIKGDSIVSVGKRGRIKIPPDAKVIDARGLVLAPGFIDTHNHSDRGFDQDPSAATQVSQGITTVAVWQDGKVTGNRPGRAIRHRSKPGLR